MFTDALAHTAKCDAYQRYSRNDLRLELPLIPSLPLTPFEMWGIDYIGLVHPTSPRKMAYIIGAVDYLTKWAKAKAVKVANAVTTAVFFHENVIVQFKVPKVLISDRGTHFLNELIEAMTEGYGIEHRKTIAYHPQTNGLAERVNQTVVRILRKTINDNEWD